MQTLNDLRRPLTRLGLVAVTYALGFALVYALTVQTLPGRRFGDLSLRGAMLTGSAAAGTVDAVLDVVSVASLLGAMAAVATVALVRLARLQGLAAIGIMVSANASTWLLKEVLLSRPDLGLDESTPATLNSMPSGHTTAVFSAVAALAFVTPARAQRAVVLAGAGAATATGLATMLAGWHRAGDSVAAFLVVGFWTAVAAAVVVVLRRPRGPVSSPEDPVVLRWPAAYAVGAVVLAGILALAMDAAPLAADSTVGSLLALLPAVLLVSGAASGAAVGILASLLVMEATAPEAGAEP